MKKFLSIFAAVALVFAMASCEEPVEEPNNNGGGNNTEQPGGNEGGGNEGGGNTEQPGGNEGGNTDSAYACLNGSDYYLFHLDGTTYNQIANKVVADLRPDGMNTHLWVWDATATAVEPIGPNYYGEIEEYMSFVPAAGWYGLAYCTYDAARLDKLKDITLNPADYVLHLAMKSQDYGTQIIKMYSGGQEFAVEIGAAGDNRKYQLPRDGEWYEIEIPMTDFTNQGLLWVSTDWAGAIPGDNLTPATAPQGGHNTVAFVGVGDPGYILGSLNYDAVFIYKPAK